MAPEQKQGFFVRGKVIEVELKQDRTDPNKVYKSLYIFPDTALQVTKLSIGDAVNFEKLRTLKGSVNTFFIETVSGMSKAGKAFSFQSITAHEI